MRLSYEGVLQGDRIEWIGDGPPATAGQPIKVVVQLLELPRETPEEKAARGKRMADALREIAARGGIPGIGDAAKWEDEVRGRHQLEERP